MGLLGAADTLRRRQRKRANEDANRAFLAKHPEFAAPPSDLIYEVTGDVSFEAFARTGRAACEALAALADAELDAPLSRVLDWGVGPARVARWWPAVRPDVDIWAGDPWAEAVAWGAAHVPGVTFTRTPHSPPAAFEDGFFDLVYGISIFTHLPLDAQSAWLAEHARILRPGGLLALTLQGRHALSRLTPDERSKWDAGEVIVRGGVPEGTRLYLAYHPPNFAPGALFEGWTVVLHEPDSVVGGGGQDLWLLRRRSAAV